MESLLLGLDQLSESVSSEGLTHLPGYPSLLGRPLMSKLGSGLPSLRSLNVSIVFKLFLPSALRGNCTDQVSVHQRYVTTVALSIPGHNMLERAASPLRSYYEEPEFSSAHHEWITPLQLLFLWILFPLVFLPHPLSRESQIVSDLLITRGSQVQWAHKTICNLELRKNDWLANWGTWIGKP